MSRLSHIKTFLLFFTKKLRLSSPWNFKVPFLIAVPYMLFLLSAHSQGAFAAIGASVCIIIGVAGFGYLTNDLGDKRKDALIQKENATSHLSTAGLVFLFALFLALAIAPWLYLPMNRWSLCLLALQFVLFYAYAFPPFRLKERGFAGVIADAAYAHVNPAVLAAYTFYLFTGSQFAGFCTFVLLLSVWQLVLGIRNILFHQLSDHDKDVASGTRTFVTYAGSAAIQSAVTKILLPLEIILFVIFSFFMSRHFFFFLPAIGLYWLTQGIRLRGGFKTLGFRLCANIYLDDLYTKWLPLIVLGGLVMMSLNFIPVLLLHVLFFRNGLKDLLKAIFA